jgi:hypothetical protein
MPDTVKCLGYVTKRRKLDVFNITIDEIKDVLLNLKLGKAVGNDKISHNMLKHTASTVCKPLEII